eukprot:scaffold13641_cov42-Cyclotella_meneghiniana.AAC.4
MQYAISFSRAHLDQFLEEKHVAVDPLPSVSPQNDYHAVRMYDLVDKVNMGDSRVGTGDLNVSLIRQISPYEVVRGFGYTDQLSQHLALGSNLYLLPSAVPSHSSLAILTCLADRLRDIRDSSVNVDETTPYAAPAATAQILFNGATDHTLPDTDA